MQRLDAASEKVSSEENWQALNGALSAHSVIQLESEYLSPGLASLHPLSQINSQELKEEGKDPDLTETMFAHIHGNTDLMVGSGLEGHVFATSMSYARRELERASTGCYDLQLQRAEKESVERMQDQLKTSESLLREIYTIHTMAQTQASQALSELQERILASVENLKPGESLLLPGGWTGSPGHAMLYQVEKMLDDSFRFHLFNSGDGLPYHPQDGDRYLCHLQWNLGNIHSMRRALSPTLQSLLTLRTFGKEAGFSTASKQLYESVLPKMESLGAKRQIGTLDDPCWMGAQKAGICTWQSIVVWERSQLKKATQKRLSLCTKVRTFQSYIKSGLTGLERADLVSVLAKRTLLKLTSKGHLTEGSFLKEASSLLDEVQVPSKLQQELLTPSQGLLTPRQQLPFIDFKASEHKQQPKIKVQSKPHSTPAALKQKKRRSRLGQLMGKLFSSLKKTFKKKKTLEQDFKPKFEDDAQKRL